MAFQLSSVDLINILLIAGGIGVCGLCLLQITASIHLRKIVRQYFQIFFIMILTYISTHLARELMNGRPGGGIRTALYTVTFFEILTAGLMAHMISMLVLSVVKPETKTQKPLFLALTGLLALHVVLQIIGCFTDLIYSFDAANVYCRGRGYFLSNLGPLAMLVVDVVLLLRHGKNIDRKVRSAFWVYMIAPIAAILIQLVFYGIQFIIFATVGAAIYMFSVIIQQQNGEYEKQQLEASRIETELSMATRIQAAMLPHMFPAFPERPEFDIFAWMDPAKEVGGDFYDFFLVDDDHLCMVMADVSGKGVPAALFMMATKIILQSCAMLGQTPAEILTKTNETICSNNPESMFVTAWVGVLELSTGKLTAANAGHEYPVFKKADGRFELYKDKHGFVLGGMSGLKYRQYELTLEPGAEIFLYTDGVAEAKNADKELFGMERTVAALNEQQNAAPKELLKTVRRAVDEFVQDAEQFDDITMLCLEYRGTKQAKDVLEIEATADNLKTVISFLEERLASVSCAPKAWKQIRLAAEEVFINVASYAYSPNTGMVTVQAEVTDEPNCVTITLMDHGVPYDPLAKEDPDVTLSPKERSIGGLGIFLTKQVMDDVAYEYRDGQNVLTLKKNL